jgi:hypothetical protein
MTDEVAAPADEQPAPATLTPKQLHRKAIVRLANLHARQIMQTREFDTVRAAADIAVLQSDLSALVGVLTAKGLIHADEFYQAAAEIAVRRGNKLFAELNAPKIEVASEVPKGEVNGHEPGGG